MNATKTLNPEFAESTSSRLARQQVIEAGAVVEAGGTKVYKVPAGWECEQIKNDPEVVQATTLRELEDALQNPDQATIFVPKTSALGVEAFETAAARTTLDSTVFWEA